jgi:hypothetical protein
MSKFLIGQRVIVRDEIGTVRRTPTQPSDAPVDRSARPGYVWVFMPSKGYASEYSEDNVEPLPNGQL